MKSPKGIVCVKCKMVVIRFWPRPEGIMCLSCVASQENEVGE